MADSPITNSQIEHLRRRMDSLETQKRMPMPTPEVGRWVWFYRQADMESEPLAALVTAQEAPGQVTLEIHPPLAQTHINVKGVHYRKHPFLDTNPQVAKMKNSGVWEFKDGDNPTETHKKLHLSQLTHMLKQCNAELLTAIEDETRRRDRDRNLSEAGGVTTPADKTTKKATPSAAS